MGNVPRWFQQLSIWHYLSKVYCRNKFGTGLSGTLVQFENLAYVQIDTLSVVERAHHHVLL